MINSKRNHNDLFVRRRKMVQCSVAPKETLYFQLGRTCEIISETAFSSA